MDGPNGWPTDNPPNPDGMGVYYRMVPGFMVRVHWQPGPPFGLLFGMDTNPDLKCWSGTIANTQHAPCIAYGQTGQRRVFARRDEGNAIHDHNTSSRSPRWEEARNWASTVRQCEDCKCKTPSYASWILNWRLNFLPKWHSKEFTDTLEAQRQRPASNWPTPTAETRTDAMSVWNATCANQWQWGSSRFRNRRRATWICVYTYSTFQHSVSQPWFICQGSQAQ